MMDEQAFTEATGVIWAIAVGDFITDLAKQGGFAPMAMTSCERAIVCVYPGRDPLAYVPELNDDRSAEEIAEWLFQWVDPHTALIVPIVDGDRVGFAIGLVPDPDLSVEDSYRKSKELVHAEIERLTDAIAEELAPSIIEEAEAIVRLATDN